MLSWGCCTLNEWWEASEQAPEGHQEKEGQCQGGRGGEASPIAEVVLAADGGGCMLGVAIIHRLEALGHAGLAHLHPVRGVVCGGGRLLNLRTHTQGWRTPPPFFLPHPHGSQVRVVMQ